MGTRELSGYNYDFDARLVAKFGVGGVVGDVVWLDWTHDGRELVALSDTGTRQMAGRRQCAGQRHWRSVCPRQQHHPPMEPATRGVAASPQSKVTAAGTYAGRIYPIPAGL
jgi:hypothetical protein